MSDAKSSQTHLSRLCHFSSKPKSGFGAVLMFCAFLSVMSWSASAGETEPTKGGLRILSEAVKSLQPHASLDTTPVDFSINGDEFSIPRNYIITMDNWSGGPQGMVGLSLLFPEMTPYYIEGNSCLTDVEPSRELRCTFVELYISGANDNSPERALENFKPIITNKVPLRGPAGLDTYEFGPPTARGILFYKNSGERHALYSCQRFSGREDDVGFCSPDFDNIDDRCGIFFRFPLGMIESAVAADSKIRHLLQTFWKD